MSEYEKLLKQATPLPWTWHPIETAPKDGREVLLLVETRAGIMHGMLVGHYMEGGFCIEDHPAIDPGWYFWNGAMFDKASKPTYWMPLPAGPDSPESKVLPQALEALKLGLDSAKFIKALNGNGESEPVRIITAAIAAIENVK